VPRALFFLLVTLISLIYFALDLEKISTKLTKFLPQKLSSGLSRLRTEFFAVAGKYAKSYILLLLITFSIMLTGFFLLGVSNALLIATVVAILDLLPVIGVGTVLVPWSVYELVLGDTGVGIGLLVLFAVHTFIRQFAEPKIVGKNLGVHPIVTLLLLYVGYSLFGFVGLLLVPIATVLIEVTVGEKNAAEVNESTARE
jgi:sporulation integral membrane protein YtvI